MSKLTELTEQGFEVRVRHLRITENEWQAIFARGAKLKYVPGVVRPKFELREAGHTISPRGGCTKVEIRKGETLVAEGEAWCNLIDNFSKMVGREVAVGRAMTVLQEAT